MLLHRCCFPFRRIPTFSLSELTNCWFGSALKISQTINLSASSVITVLVWSMLIRSSVLLLSRAFFWPDRSHTSTICLAPIRRTSKAALSSTGEMKYPTAIHTYICFHPVVKSVSEVPCDYCLHAAGTLWNRWACAEKSQWVFLGECHVVPGQTWFCSDDKNYNMIPQWAARGNIVSTANRGSVRLSLTNQDITFNQLLGRPECRAWTKEALMLMFEYKDKTQTKIAAGIKPGKHVGTNTGAKQMQMDQILDIRIRILY